MLTHGEVNTLMDKENNQRVIATLYSELLAGDMRGFRQHYDAYRTAYVNFARRYTEDEELIADSYQDAFIVLYENVVEQKVTELNSSLKTYVFSIAKYSLFAKLRSRGKEIVMDDLSPVINENARSQVDQMDDPRLDQLREGMKNLSEGCRKILTLFYYRRYSIDAIMHEMSLKNENTVKAHKSRCLKKLKDGILKGNQNGNE